ncbi:MAG: SpoIIE family protein phosphatase [Planctomycetales bacterium]|nr:SpoIIE family protein phosphatase [Planctomycetales bacterium]NIM09174.1 SpoIIE family protein phosphatase [Planctomycetales bacterium]NIN08650.1 SpoIIE family protein phosphatase [Planctomycetales bacterium]NIN77769.1 SpoIIE family protein phosphatase [Planctomycetales bacterium]NIO34946.1 SpoIIE family protein phosphatase [Planctomycetales bacterium]
MSTPSLTITQGPQAGVHYDLTRPRNVLGRHPDCEIVLDAGAVSRQHAQVLMEGSRVFVEDLQSRNGTFVNDQAVLGRRELINGDSLRICDLVMRFDDGVSPREETSIGLPADSWRAIMIDDEPTSTSSRIMSKLDISENSRMRLEANPLTKLKALLEITANLGKSIALEDVLSKVLDSLFTIFLQADRGFVALRQGAEGELVPKAIKFRRPENEDPIRISRTIVDEVIHKREAILSADASQDNRFQMSQSIADFSIRSVMCAPLMDSDGQPLGVIQIDTMNQRDRFSVDDLELLVGVAGPAGLAIQNAQLHENVLQQQALQRDLQMAHQVQQGFLPETPPDLPGYHFFDFYHSAYEVGGDYYDYVHLQDGRVAIVVGDVSGKGVAAALLTAKLSSEVRFCLASDDDLAKAVGSVNRMLCSSLWDDRFVTMVFLVLDPPSGNLELVNAGHLPPLLRHGDGRVEPAGEEGAGLPLGVDVDYAYETVELQLASGACVALYTDGFSEAMNAAGELYGLQRLQARLADPVPTVTALGKYILDDVTQHVDGHPQSDDMCLVCVGRAADDP